MRAFVAVTILLVCGIVVLARAQAQQTVVPEKAGQSGADLSQLRAKAEAGDAVAQFQLGKAYEQGEGVPQNDGLAASWYRKAAEQGNAAADNGLGVLYRLGRGVEKSKEEAVSWYRKGAKLGSAEAMFNLGACYYNGDGVGEDPVTAYAWFLLSQEAGSAAAKEAVHRSETEAGYSNDSASLRIGEMYEKGEDLPQSYVDAAHWYRKAADHNGVAAMRLAAFLIDGKGMNRDYGQAMEICRNSAKQHYSPASYCVGYLYQRGLGVDVDKKEAVKWFGQAAELGFAKAALVVAEMYMNGDGVSPDRAEAYYFFFLAYRGGNRDAKARAHSLHQEMNKEEIKRLEKRLREHYLDPKKVYATVDAAAPPDSSKERPVLPLVVR